MKKLLVLAITAVAVAGLMPITSKAANVTTIYRQTGYQECVSSEAEKNQNEIKEKLKNLGLCVRFIKWNNCPDFNFPNNNLPDINLPTPEIPAPEAPETDKPNTDKPETDKPETDKPETDNESTELTFAEQVVKLVNEERVKAGLNTLVVDPSVEAAALVRAKETVTSFSHTRPDGSSFSTALTENGVKFRGSGENIAWGQKTPEEVMKGWMNSPGHRANILNEKFTTIGVGYYQNTAGTNYWTQLFTY